MKIFFLASFYFDLYKPILEELRNEGHDVFLVEDVGVKYDYRLRKQNILSKFIGWIYRKIDHTMTKYWEQKILSDTRYSDSYDLLLCINGVSFHESLLSHLRAMNPNIRTVLYVWDSNRYYNYYHHARFFEKVYTFDAYDAATIQGVTLLPSYWVPSPVRPVKYKVSMVGSDHDDRLSIVSKIYEQLEGAGLPSNLRIVLKEPPKPDLWRSWFSYFKKRYQRMMAEWEAKKTLPYTTEKKYSIAEIVEMIDESECVLDTDMPIQTGATQRVIWSLAKGKKIISTNYSLKNMPFFRDDQIKFIDRNHPVIDLEFLRSQTVFDVDPYILSLRIDKWVQMLVS